MDDNPFSPPEMTVDTGDAGAHVDRRFFFLLIPPATPPIAFTITYLLTPAPSDGLIVFFTLGLVIPLWIWSKAMVDRMQLLLWQSLLLTAFSWGTVLASALLSPPFIGWILAARSVS
ncbi:MAG: hypothetical protein R3B96_12475 [Pirellulaceae bacterium]